MQYSDSYPQPGAAALPSGSQEPGEPGIGGLPANAEATDSRLRETAESDAGEADATDSRLRETAESDAGESDAGESDAGEADAGESDAGEADPSADTPAPGRSRARKWLRRLGAALVILSLLAGAGFYYLWTWHNGPALAERLARSFNRQARGRMTIGSVRWTPSAAIDLLLNRDHRVVIEDFRIYDTQGRLVAHFPRIEAWGKLWPLLRHGDFDVSRARAETAHFRIDYYERPDGPHRVTGSRHEVGLLSAFEPTDPTEPKPKRAKVYDFNNLYIRRASISMHHRLFELYFHKLEARGDLVIRGASRDRRSEVRFSVKPSGGVGLLRMGGKTLALRGIRAPYVRTAPDQPTNLAFAVGGKVGAAGFRLSAEIHGFHQSTEPELRLHATVTDFAAPLAQFTGLALKGSDETLALNIEGPLRAPVFAARLWGLSGRYPIGGKNLEVEDIRARARLHGSKLKLESLTCQALNGALALRGQLELTGRTFDGRLDLKGLSITSLLSTRRHRALLGGELAGHVGFAGSLEKRAIAVPSVDLTLTRSGRDGALPKRLRLRGGGGYDGARIQLERLELSGRGLKLSTRGQVEVASRRLKLAVKLEVGRLAQLLRRARLPALARRLSLQGRLRGTLRRPRLFGRATLRHVGHRHLRAKRLRSRITFMGGSLSLRNAKADLAGGTVTGSGQVSVIRPGTWRLRRHPYFRGRFDLVAASLARLAPGRGVHGRVGVKMRLKGRPGAITGQGRVRVRDARLAGQHVRRGQASLRLERDGLRFEGLAVHWAKGGTLRAAGRYDWRRRNLAVKGEIDALPLAALLPPRVRRALRGRLSGRFHVRGEQARPLIDAVLRLAAVQLRGVRLGTGQVSLAPDGADTRVQGELFDRCRVTGRLKLQPEPRLEIQIAFEDLAVHEFVPQLQRLPGRARVHATGHLAVTVHLRHGIERVEAKLSSLKARLEQQDTLPGETPGWIALKNRGPVHLVYSGSRLQVSQLRLVAFGRNPVRGSRSGSSPDPEKTDGELTITGWLSPQEAKLTVVGNLQLAPYAWLASRWLDTLEGRIWLKGTLQGPLRRPRWSSRVWLAGVVLRPVGRRVPVRIPTARVRLSDRELHLEHARVAIHTDEFTLAGKVALNAFRPQHLALSLRGKLSAQVLRLAIPRTFNHVTGRARASLRINGPLDHPDVGGRIRLEPVTFTLRGSGREFALQGGEIRIANRRIRLREIRGSVDDGTYVVDGRIRMRPTWPWDMDLSIGGQGIPVRKSRSYELELNAQLRYRLVGGEASLQGSVDVADGRFTESFDVVSRAFLRRRTAEQRPAFWETHPLLRDARLNVVIATRGPLIIKNNLADIRLEGNISLGGTPRAPRIGGRIQAESGTFRIPFLRGEYRVQSGEIDFDHPFGFGETYVRIIGETTYTDHSETEHDIRLTLEGPVSRIGIKLSSNTGLNQSQIVMLLASGRTVRELRQQLKGRNAGSGNGGRSSNPLDAYDSSLKQVTGDFLSQLVAKPLQAFTKLDLVRLEMGTESFRVRVNKNLGRNVRLAGEAEFGLLGRQRQEGRVEVRVLDQLNVNARARRLIPGEDTVIDEDRYQGRLELRYKIRIRHSLRRALGL